jgi:peptide/nickel transport system substrate-binding protein
MRWQVYADALSAASALRVRDIDILSGSRDDLQPIAEEVPDIDMHREPGLSWLALGFRLDRPPFTDERVREAIDLALDRDAMIRDLARSDGQVTGPVNPHLAEGFWALSEDDVRLAFGGSAPIDERRTHARQLLTAAAAEGASFVLQVADLPPLVDIADVVRQQLQEAGLAVTVEAQGLLSWYTNFRRGAFEASLVNHLPYETPDVPTRFFHSGGPDATTSPFAFADQDIDALVERSWSEADRSKRQSTLRDAQRLMINARPLVQLYTSAGYTAAWRQVQNLRPGLPGSLAQYNYEQWLLEDDAD